MNFTKSARLREALLNLTSTMHPALFLALALTSNAAVLYVDLNSTNPTPPYTNWVTAATNIQDAVDAAVAGDQILVTNGVYQSGGKAGTFGVTNRVSVDKSVVLQSINGPEVTWINGNGEMRCVRLVNGSLLTGFTLTNGFAGPYGSGGGVAFADFGSSAVVSNCVIVGCIGGYGGGGVGNDLGLGGYAPFGGTLNNCVLRSNSAGPLPFAPGVGGGAYGTTLNNCILAGNTAIGGPGGGASSSTLRNCTLVGNSASYAGPGSAAAWSDLKNCIVYYNSELNYSDCSITYSCTTPLASGVGNITNAPLFVDYAAGDLRLRPDSPCINAGNNAYVTSATDLDGNPRIVSGTVDIGDYEYQGPGSVISYAWLQHYGLPTDGSADALDTDLDGHTTWQEWVAWTDPTDPLSVLKLLPPKPQTNGTLVLWQSVLGQSYSVERATNASGPFSLLQDGIPGQLGTTSFTDTNAVNLSPLFYRVRVGN